MDTPSGKPTVIKGTPPTPENPNPSNQIVEEYPDGPTVIYTPRPTRKVLQEYEQALRQYPENAELHLHYGRALSVVNKDTQALAHMQEAVRLKPDWAHTHAMLGHLLQKRGDTAQAPKTTVSGCPSVVVLLLACSDAK